MVQISLLLRFNFQTSDGYVIGTAHVQTKANDGNVPQKGERVHLCSENSSVNVISERYDIRVTDVCRNLGGGSVLTVLCDIGFSTWNQHTGKNESEGLTAEEVLVHWKTLEKYFRAPESYDIDICSFTFFNLNKI